MAARLIHPIRAGSSASRRRRRRLASNILNILNPPRHDKFNTSTTSSRKPTTTAAATMSDPIRTILAPSPLPAAGSPAWSTAVFLAGTCAALPDGRNWRSELAASLPPRASAPAVTLVNPERADWDSSWVEHPSDRRFGEQTAWELTAQRFSGVLVFFFQAASTGAVAMLELGLALGRKQGPAAAAAAAADVIVGCEPGFWKAGNVLMACQAAGVPVCESYDELVGKVREAVGRLG